MSSEIDAAGAAATASLVAAAIDDPKTSKKRGHGACANCGADLSGKKFCSECGQTAHLHHALLNMIEEFVRGLVFFDTRIWRTLAMLVFRPGTLTHNYVHGKRARYISPLSLFLLAVFAMFFVFSMIGGSRIGVSSQSTTAERVADSLETAEEGLKDAEETLAEAKQENASGGQIEAAQLQVNARRAVVERLKGAQAAAKKGDALPTADDFVIEELDPDGDKSFYDEIREGVQTGKIKINTGWPAFDANLKENLLNPELAVYKIQNAAYKFAFLLVPISLPFVWLMFMWRRGTTLFDHTVYILYSLSFVSLTFIAFSLLAVLPGGLEWLAAPLILASPVHTFFHLKGGYGLSIFSTMWRMPFQLVFSLIGLTIFLVVILALGLVG